MNLDNAIATHAQWKMKFRGAIAGKQLMDAATIAKDNCCEVGQWLHGEGQSSWGGRPEFVALIARHKTFHSEAGKVAAAINAKNFEIANKMIDSSTPFAAASSAVGVAILALKKVINQPVKV
jgi:methyl-accepting chemotaxis protein